MIKVQKWDCAAIALQGLHAVSRLYLICLFLYMKQKYGNSGWVRAPQIVWTCCSVTMDSTWPFFVVALSTRAPLLLLLLQGGVSLMICAAQQGYGHERAVSTQNKECVKAPRAMCYSMLYYNWLLSLTHNLLINHLMNNMETNTLKEEVENYWAVLLLLKSRPDAMWTTDGALSRDSHRL